MFAPETGIAGKWFTSLDVCLDHEILRATISLPYPISK
jgi:hypothetical protein